MENVHTYKHAHENKNSKSQFFEKTLFAYHYFDVPNPSNRIIQKINSHLLYRIMKRSNSKLLWLLFLAISRTFAAGDFLDPDHVDCPLCADPTHRPQDEFSIFDAGFATLTCRDAFDLGDLRLPLENCTFWQSRGDVICQCASSPPIQNNCTLCEDGGSLPFPRREGSPGKLCAVLQVEAVRDTPDLCPTWQATFGTYCGCENPIATAPEQEICRLCGDNVDLPDPNLVVPYVTTPVDFFFESSKSCGQLEFSANIPGANCDELRGLYGGECCQTAEGQKDESAGAVSSQKVLSFASLILSLL